MSQKRQKKVSYKFPEKLYKRRVALQIYKTFGIWQRKGVIKVLNVESGHAVTSQKSIMSRVTNQNATRPFGANTYFPHTGYVTAPT